MSKTHNFFFLKSEVGASLNGQVQLWSSFATLKTNVPARSNGELVTKADPSEI